MRNLKTGQRIVRVFLIILDTGLIEKLIFIVCNKNADGELRKDII
jgi:hypothetical protein